MFFIAVLQAAIQIFISLCIRPGSLMPLWAWGMFSLIMPPVFEPARTVMCFSGAALIYQYKKNPHQFSEAFSTMKNTVRRYRDV